MSDVSADGSKILYGSLKEESDIWGVTVANGDEFEFTSSVGCELWPDSSPDGRSVAFQATRDLSQGDKFKDCAILTRSIGGDSRQIRLAAGGIDPTWSPDGSRLAFLRSSKDVGLWTIRPQGRRDRAQPGLYIPGLPLSLTTARRPDSIAGRPIAPELFMPRKSQISSASGPSRMMERAIQRSPTSTQQRFSSARYGLPTAAASPTFPPVRKLDLQKHLPPESWFGGSGLEKWRLANLKPIHELILSCVLRLVGVPDDLVLHRLKKFCINGKAVTLSRVSVTAQTKTRSPVLNLHMLKHPAILGWPTSHSSRAAKVETISG